MSCKYKYNGVEYTLKEIRENINSILLENSLNPTDLLKGENFVGKDGEANYQRWKGENKEVSGEEVQKVKTGEPIVVKGFHGTTNEFYEFDASVKGNIEGHLGKVNYFTSDYQDASQNYLAEGADITGRIEREVEVLEQQFEDRPSELYQKPKDFEKHFNVKVTQMEIDEVYGDERAVAELIASKRLIGADEKVLKVYVKLNNPVVLGNGSTWFDALEIDDVYLEEALQEIAEENDISEEEAKEDYEYDIRDRAIEKQGDGNKIVEALEDALTANGYDSSNSLDILGDNFYEIEVDLNQLEKDIRSSELYDNDEGEFASAQVISDFFKNLGFDGIILTDVSKRFLNMGLGESTSHIHVFDEYSNQIKLSDGANSTFGETRDIRFQKRGSRAVPQITAIQAKIATYQSANDIGLEIVNLYPQSKSEDIQREFNECAI